MDFEDQELIARIAAGANNYMSKNASLAQNRSEAERLGFIDKNTGRIKRVDFKEHLNGYQPGRPFGQPQQYHEQFNPQQWPQGIPQAPGWNTQVNEDGVPDGNLNGPIKQYVLPSNIPVPNNGVQYPNQPYQSGVEGSEFNMPNYNQQKEYLADEQDFRDALIKEIKTQKKSLNKLIKTNEQLIVTVNLLKDKVFELAEKLKIELTPEPIPEQIIDEVKDKS